MARALQERTVSGERFEFGENWRRFAAGIVPSQIEAADASLRTMLNRESLAGMSFLDIGSGSGLFSLSAVRLGAERVHSLDSDPASVATTAAVKERFAPEAEWTIERASVLDAHHMRSLGQWDVVYAWGVLHHTGSMWDAMAITCDCVSSGGHLFVSIYNDQGRKSKLWRAIKRLYNRLPRFLRGPYVVVAALPMELRLLALYSLKLRPHHYLREWRESGERQRGMNRWRDLVDWVGGYPFEVATPDQVFGFCASRGFELRKLQTAGGAHGCNQFVFELPHAAIGS